MTGQPLVIELTDKKGKGELNSQEISTQAHTLWKSSFLPASSTDKTEHRSAPEKLWQDTFSILILLLQSCFQDNGHREWETTLSHLYVTFQVIKGYIPLPTQ